MGGSPVPLAVEIASILLVAGLALTFLRLLRGPTLADRVVALDLIAIIAVGIIAVYALRTGEEQLLDAAVVLALISFVATVALARIIERGGPG